MQERLEKVFRLAFGLMVLCMHPLQAAHDLGKPLLLLLRWAYYRTVKNNAPGAVGGRWGRGRGGEPLSVRPRAPSVPPPHHVDRDGHSASQ